MSALTEELPKAAIMEWRKFAGTPAFQLGIDWLRHNINSTSGESDIQIVRAAARWRGYMDALDDVQDILTALPKKEIPIDEPALEGVTPRE